MSTCFYCSHSPNQYNRTKHNFSGNLRAMISGSSAATKIGVQLHLFFTVLNQFVQSINTSTQLSPGNYTGGKPRNYHEIVLT